MRGNSEFDTKFFDVKDYTIDLKDSAIVYISAINSISGKISGNAELHYTGLKNGKLNVKVSDNAKIIKEDYL